MISVDSLLYKIDQKLNKLATNEHQQIQLEDKILALNEAQLKLIINKVNGISVPSGLGFDSFRKRYDDLQKIVVDYSPLSLKKEDGKLNRWSGDVSLLSPKYMLYISSYITADKEDCKGRVVWVNGNLAKHSDVSLLLNNEHYKPSFEYQETFSTLSSDRICVYTDGTFTPKKLYVMYIRYPVYINKTGYVGFDGEPSSDVDCELADYLEDNLLALAVQELAMNTENISAVQSSQMRIQTTE